MEIINYKMGERIAAQKDAVVALGYFDGVHLAHRELLLAARDEADRQGLDSSALAFHGTIKRGAAIYPIEERLRLIAATGIDRTVLAELSELKELSCEEFVRDVLIGSLRCRVAVCGFNFRFGRGAVGDCEFLCSLMRRAGGDCIVVPEMKIGDITASSSAVRAYLAEGNVREARAILGEPYYIRATVENGAKRGRKNGIPTANMPLDGAIIASGVYASEAVISGESYPAVTNIGTCPTYGERQKHAESYIIGFSGDLYGKDIVIKFLDYLREEKRFDNEKALIMQINIDKDRALRLYGEEK